MLLLPILPTAAHATRGLPLATPTLSDLAEMIRCDNLETEFMYTLKKTLPPYLAVMSAVIVLLDADIY